MVKVLMMFSRLFLLLLLLIFTFIHCSTNNNINIPFGQDIIIDGTLKDSEWSDALQSNLMNGGEVLLKRNKSHLFIGIRGIKMGWAHICVATPTQVLILHSSAALGSAKYQKVNHEFFYPVNRFVWEMRDTTQTVAAKVARSNFLDKYKWVASTAWMGNPLEREFILKKEMFQEQIAQLVILYASDEEHPDYYYWPTMISDDALNENLAFGKTPDSLKFEIEQWATITLD